MTPSEAAEKAAQNAVDKFVEFMQLQDSQNTLTMALGGMIQGGFLPMDAANTISEFLQRTFTAGFEAGSDVAFTMALARFREIVDEIKEIMPNPNQPWFKDPERLIGERLRDEF